MLKLKAKEIERLENTSHVAAFCADLTQAVAPVFEESAIVSICGGHHSLCSHTACSNDSAASEFADVDYRLEEAGFQPVAGIDVQGALDSIAQFIRPAMDALRESLQPVDEVVVGSGAGPLVRETIADFEVNECVREPNSILVGNDSPNPPPDGSG